MTRTAVDVAVLAALAAGALGAMGLGWRRRADRWADLVADLPAAPEAATEVLGPVPATYVATTPDDDRWERIPAARLGVRAPADVVVTDVGLLVRRDGGPDLYVPGDRLVDAAPADGIAGTAVGRGRLALVRWRAGDRVLATGLLPRHERDRTALIEAVNLLARRRK